MATAATRYRLVPEATLIGFVRALITGCNVDPVDAEIVADILVAADLRGIESYGVGQLVTHMADRLRDGRIDARPTVEIVRETGTSLVVDAGKGLGQPVAKRTMDTVIAKAREHGAAFATVRNSNDFGIAGYYAMQALKHDLIGMVTTSTGRDVVPTFGREMILGSNPFAYAVPAGTEPPFVLDFAATATTRGVLERYGRAETGLESGWAVDVHGVETHDPQAALAGALLPLGGFGVDNGGHKGYGLSLLADIFCGVLSGGTSGTAGSDQTADPNAVAHWFAAFRVDGFRDIADFRHDMDRALRGFKDSAKAGAERIYVAGEIEHEKTITNRANGIPVLAQTWAGLERLAGELSIVFEFGPTSGV